MYIINQILSRGLRGLIYIGILIGFVLFVDQEFFGGEVQKTLNRADTDVALTKELGDLKFEAFLCYVHNDSTKIALRFKWVLDS